jgi:energy-coupling factor transporter ATP-binding protein EcfA2
MAIEIDGLSYLYSKKDPPALQDVDLSIPEGAFVLVGGPTGCGKSTLALCLNGLIPHTAGGHKSGRVIIDGLDTDESSVQELARYVGVVFQDPEAQLCQLLVGDEIAFGPENLNVPPDEIRTRVARYLSAVAMDGRVEAYVGSLSGGQKQRTALASVLAMEPRILVLDEPTSNLDLAGAREFLEVLGAIARERRMTIVAIEHQVDRLCEYTDLSVFMESGQIVAQGTPDQLFQDKSLLARRGIPSPQVTRLVVALQERHGIQHDRLPLTIPEAKQWLISAGVSLRRRQFPDGAESQDSDVQLELEHVSYTYPGGDTALEDIELRIGKGDFVALVGQNGSGKTTLTKHFVGLLSPRQGRVLLDGRDTAKWNIRQITSRVGYVFQYPNHQFVRESVIDEVAYSLRIRGIADEPARKRAMEALEFFGLERYANRHPFALSMGEKRRLSVATMVVMDQDILILDEPTMGLDWGQTEALLDLLTLLNSEGRTIVVITHEPQLIARWATKVIAMSQGRIVFEGTPREFFGRPEILALSSMDAPPVVHLARDLEPSLAWTETPITLDEFVSATQTEAGVAPMKGGDG